MNDLFMPVTNSRRWLVATGVMLIILIIVLLYVTWTTGNLVTWQTWSFVSAATASFLYATSFSMGSISYYVGWPDMRQLYQKYIGLWAYFLSLFYCLTLLILYPGIYLFGFLDNFFTPDILLGLLAMGIFTTMVVIPSLYSARFFKPETIKFTLRLGYLGYVFLVVRALIIDFEIWLQWLTTLEGYPPGRLVLSFVAVCVVLLRLSVPIHKFYKTKVVGNA